MDPSSKCRAAVDMLLTEPDFQSLLGKRAGWKLPISCEECSSSGVEGSARAFLHENPLGVTLCTNRLRSDDDVRSALRHELVHAYDYKLNRYDFSTCEGLAGTEIRAAREAECNRTFPLAALKELCIEYHATRSTANLFPEDAAKCVRRQMKTASKDMAPFQSNSS
jgi:hypothetical protein